MDGSRDRDGGDRRAPADAAHATAAHATAAHATAAHATGFAADFAQDYFGSPDTAEVSGDSWSRLSRHLDLGMSRDVDETAVATTELDDGSVQVQVVTDDIALLVESVLAVLDMRGLGIVANDHPILPVRRDDDGTLLGLGDRSPGDGTIVRESWISITAGPASGIDADLLRADVGAALVRARAVAHDAADISAWLSSLIESFDDEDADILSWFAVRDNFLPVGCRQASPGRSGLGVWRDAAVTRPEPGVDRPDGEVIIDREYLPTGVLRTNFPMLLRIVVDGVEHQVVGAITTLGQYQSVRSIPGVRGKIADVLRGLQLTEDSYGGIAALELLQTYPLGEVMAADSDTLRQSIGELLEAQTSRDPRFSMRTGVGGGFASILVFMPREQYSSDVRARLVTLLERELAGDHTEFTTRLSSAPLAQLHVLMRTGAGVTESVDGRLVSRLAEESRTWSDRVRRALPPGSVGARLLGTVDARYRDERNPADAAVDLPIAAALEPGSIHVRVDRSDPAAWRVVLYLADRSAVLTELLPMLQSLGLTVVDEHPHRIDRPDGVVVDVYDFTAYPAPQIDVTPSDDLDERIAEAFVDMWSGTTEVDDLNRLVLQTGLSSRTIAVLRMYARYLNQCGTGFTTAHVADVLGEHRTVTQGIVDLFAASFDPDRASTAERERARIALRAGIAEVLSLDADRVLSALAGVVEATVRTNAYRDDRRPGIGRTIAVKLETRSIPFAPLPRPEFEIYVYSPTVEGVHLRFGTVARGGLRWSDRREDFRTEILGLVKAQAVKNAVIVPVGAKGGFVVRRPSPPTGDPVADRQTVLDEGAACYRAFIGALLQVTDNLDPASGRIVGPPRVVRRDGDDPYLVVAADKGTARFSDIANAVAEQYRFWLGDAFASGGSVGYDHKAMGITARGAWESVKRHFWEMGIDTQTEDFTVVGVGDMSGDVFGNGMLLSRHIRLVAAFDHRHIFIDPDPDAGRSYTERARLFALPRSAWDDYDRSLISAGGGVFSREQKSIEVSPQMRAALGLADAVTELSPPDLMRAVLLAPVDLLFNGGIGTYVKASAESNASVGDKANDAIRVDGSQLRATVVGEGGNLGVTEHGRIEADLAGVRINSDALDNSAGVDCSDHEVNLKILLNAQVSAGRLAADDRDELLLSMTDDVAELVLADNIDQNAELGLARATADDDVDLHARILDHLAETGVDLALEALPTSDELRGRRASETARGLTSPELATMMAHVKLDAKQRLLQTTLPDSEVFEQSAAAYFPEPVRDRFADGIRTHRLRREIVTTVLVNRAVADGGLTHLYALGETAGTGVDDAMRATVVATRVFGIGAVLTELRSEKVSASIVDDATRRVRGLLAAGARWFLMHRPQPLALAAETSRYGQIADLAGRLDEWISESAAGETGSWTGRLVEAGVRRTVAQTVATGPYRLHLLDVLDLAEITDREPTEVGEVLFAVIERFGFGVLTDQIADLPAGDRWSHLARLSLSDELHAVLRSLTLSVLATSEPDEPVEEKVDDWVQARSVLIARARGTLDDLDTAQRWDLATLSVAVRALRSVVG